MSHETDPRPLYRDALASVRTLAAAVPAERLTEPTPCAASDVRGLLGHLVATVDRARVIGEGGDPDTMPRVITGIDDDGWVDALTGAEDKTAPVWSDDARLDAEVVVPWGRVPGRAALFGYLREALVHGWDLAVATGQDAEADPATAAAVLLETRRMMPAEPRGGPISFADRCRRGPVRARRSSWPTGAGTPAVERRGTDAAARSGSRGGGDHAVSQDCGRRSGMGGSTGTRGAGNESGVLVGTCRSRRRMARPSSTPTNPATATHTVSTTMLQPIQPHTTMPLCRTSLP